MSTASTAVFDNPQFDEWLKKEILRLSVDALHKHMVVCTACGQVKGDYIIDYQNEQYRFDEPKTYAFLTFLLAQG